MAPRDTGPPPENASAAPGQVGGTTQLDLVSENSGISRISAPRTSTPTAKPTPLAVRPKPEPIDEDFNWSTDLSVIICEQPATAIYWNRHHQLVIRQKAAWDMDEDVFVYISQAHLEHLIAMLRAEAEAEGAA